MAYRKKTIRRLPPKTKEIAKIINEMEQITNRLKNRLNMIAQFERESQALFTAQDYLKNLTSEPKSIKTEPIVTEPLFPDDEKQPQKTTAEVSQDNAERKESAQPDSQPNRKRQRRQTVEEKNIPDNPSQEVRTEEPNSPDNFTQPESEINTPAPHINEKGDIE